MVEGLSASGHQYEEVFDCASDMINPCTTPSSCSSNCQTPSLKNGSGEELRWLYDTVNQHLYALKAMNCEPSGQFITSLSEVKVDPTTIFEWQEYSQDSSEVPHFSALSEFINMQAQAFKLSVPELNKKHQSEALTHKHNFLSCPVTSLNAAGSRCQKHHQTLLYIGVSLETRDPRNTTRHSCT